MMMMMIVGGQLTDAGTARVRATLFYTHLYFTI